jgi:tetratricopeptide (TPR) repeat protein
METPEQLLDQVRNRLQAGQLTEAQSLCRQILEQAPKHAEATHILGFLAHLSGDPQTALGLIERAAELEPGNPVYQHNLGDLHSAMGHMDQAEACLRKALELKPEFASAAIKLGIVMEQRNQLHEAIQLYRRAIELEPHVATGYCNLGDALQKQRKLDEALEQYNIAIKLAPNMAEAYCNRAVVYDALMRLEDAINDATRAVQIKPDLVQAWSVLGLLLRAQGRLDQAMQCFEQIVLIQPNNAQAYVELGNTRHAQGQFEAACELWRHAIQIDPRLVHAYANLGLTLLHLGEVEQSEAVFDAGMTVDPRNVQLRANRAFLLASKGDLAQGLKEYDLRWQTDAFRNVGRKFSSPRWEGEDISGKRLVVWHEQGAGDTIQFIRYVKLLKRDRGAAEIIVEAPPPLHRLLSSMPEIARLITREDPEPQADFHCPVLRLPGLFHTTLENIPAHVPYLSASQELIQRWAQRTKKYPGFRVGIAWEGSRTNTLNRLRSASLEDFRRLSEIPDVQLFSLQWDRQDLIDFNVRDLANDFTDFADTAAAIANLDLVISIDSAIAHLAGAMGRPTWTVLSAAPDQRWLLKREDCPWYPTMRLFRQSRLRQWEPVFQRVESELRSLRAK